MVPFSFPQPLLKSRVMKERLLTLSPLTGAKRATQLPHGVLHFPNGVHGVDHRPSRWQKTQKRLNEPNSKNANPPLNIDDFTNFDFFKKWKRTHFNPIPTQFLSLKPIHILVMLVARAARTSWATHLHTPNSQLLNNWVQRHAGWVHGVDHRPSRWKNTKTTKRTQFKKC